jgi:hypothetical protein
MTDKRAGLGSLLFILTTLAALVFARPPESAPAQAGPAYSPSERRVDGSQTSSGAGSAVTEEAGSWEPYIRLYEEFFAITAAKEVAKEPLQGSPEQRVSERLKRIVARAKANGYQLDFLVALVPDPADSRLAENFDLITAGIQMALGESGQRYLYDREWLPNAQRENHRYRRSAKTSADLAGIRLLRGIPEGYSSNRASSASPGKHLMAVFLVSETPFGGIQKEAFRQSVLFIKQLTQELNETRGTADGAVVAASPAARTSQGPSNVQAAPGSQAASACPEIRVVGPPSSGSAESLAIAIRSLDDTQCGFHVVTGSATAPGLERLFPASVTFDRTILPDDVLIDSALSFLQRRLAWDLNYAALVIEEGTTYADYFKFGHSKMIDQVHARIFLPAGLQAIRNAWEEQRAGKRHEPPPVGGALMVTAPAARGAGPEVTLVDAVTPYDLSAASPLTAHFEDVVLESLLQRITTSYRYRYIGIIATDIKDSIFVAERLHHWDPDVELFVFENNLLYSHPSASAPMFGSLAISTFPLLSTGTPPPEATPPGVGGAPTRRFASEAQQGVFLATKCLLGDTIIDPSACSISAIGKNGMVPLAYIPVARAVSQTCKPRSGQRPKVAAQTGDLPLLCILVLLIFSGWLVWRQVPVSPTCVQSSGLLAWSAVVLCLVADGLHSLLCLPEANPSFFNGEGQGALAWFVRWGSYLTVIYCLVVIARAAGVVSWTAAQPHDRSRKIADYARGGLAAVAILVCATPLLYGVQRWLLGPWSLGEPGMLYLRARRFSNGLSPFVSLAWCGCTLFAWLMIEVRRQQLRGRHELPGPDSEDDAALEGLQRAQRKLRGLFEHTLVRELGFWAVAAAFLFLTIPPFWQTSQPVIEPAAYGRLFLCLLALLFLLCAMSFYRFARAWQLLRRVLVRLQDHRCHAWFTKISKRAQWNAMSSFVLYTSTYRGLIQPIEMIEQHLDDLTGQQREMVGTLRKNLKDAYEQEGACRIKEEGSARRQVGAELRCLVHSLKGTEHFAYAHELDAFLIVAYLRHVFVQLRFALIGAMVPALLLLAAVDSYAFLPKHYLWILFWAAVITASLMSLGAFVQMDRDTVLSEIGGTPPGKVRLSFALLSNIFAYAVLPVIALLSSQMPQWGEVIDRWLGPLTRIFETS